MLYYPKIQFLTRHVDLIFISFLFSLFVGLLGYYGSLQYFQNRHSVKGRIRHALNKSGAGFYCVYQPINEIETGKVIGCEVLARFSDHEGKLFPDEFIPIVEKLGKSWTFTEIILERAFKDLKPFLKDKPDFKVSFNFYPKDLQDNNLKNFVENKNLQFAASNLLSINCEILETGIGEHSDLDETVQYLHSKGFSIAIDDFGTGYSNLNFIREVQAEFLKIDMSFIHGLSIDNESAVRSSLVPHIVEIANILNLQVIAEGIENETHLAALKSLNVKYGQGYYYSPPAELEAFLEYIKNAGGCV